MHKIAILLSQLDVRIIFLIMGSVGTPILILPARCFFITSFYYNTTNCECQALYMLIYKKIISRFSEESRDISYFIMNKFPKVAVLIEKKNQLLFDVDTTLSTKVRYCSPVSFTSRIFTVPPIFSQIVYTHSIRLEYDICRVVVCSQQIPETVPRESPGIRRLLFCIKLSVTADRTISLYAVALVMLSVG